MENKTVDVEASSSCASSSNSTSGRKNPFQEAGQTHLKAVESFRMLMEACRKLAQNRQGFSVVSLRKVGVGVEGIQEWNRFRGTIRAHFARDGEEHDEHPTSSYQILNWVEGFILGAAAKERAERGIIDCPRAEGGKNVQNFSHQHAGATAALDRQAASENVAVYMGPYGIPFFLIGKDSKALYTITPFTGLAKIGMILTGVGGGNKGDGGGCSDK
ncbi:unnamed protein product [Amoebophrya sp. A120]|nr:unnamed protein product [Amoebophrya sp. A120]|eukprot:GSA120T00018199001.1